MLIQSPQKNKKIGSKESENRQNLSYERGLIHSRLKLAKEIHREWKLKNE